LIFGKCTGVDDGDVVKDRAAHRARHTQLGVLKGIFEEI